MFYQPTAGYPDDKMFIGRWLVLVIDVGTAMTYKILRPNGGYVCRSTVCAWTPLEEANVSLLAESMSFMTQLTDSIGPAANPQDFPYRYLTPDFEYYADGMEDGLEGTPDEIPAVPVPTSELGDKYGSVSLSLPHGSVMAQGRVVKHYCDNDGNVVGRANENPILDTREYCT